MLHTPARELDRETAPQIARKPYPSDIGDDEWAFVAPYLTLMTQEAPRGDTRCARSSTACAGSCAPVPSGA
jgi:hypothetical protein